MAESVQNGHKTKLEGKRLAFLRKIRWDLIIRWLIFTGGVAGLVALFPMGATPQYSDLKLDIISPYEVIAPFDFEILKSKEELEKQRAEARAAVLPIFRRVDEVADKHLTRLDSLFNQLQGIIRDQQKLDTTDSLSITNLQELNQKYNTKFSFSDFIINQEAPSDKWWNNFTQSIKSALKSAFQTGIINREPETINTSANAIVIFSQGIKRRVSLYNVAGMTLAKNVILEQLKSSFPEGDRRVKIGYEIVLNFIEPDIIFDEKATEEKQAAAAHNVAIAKGIVLKDERIIDSNERVTEEHLEKIRSIISKKRELTQEKGGFTAILPQLGKVLFSAGILFLFGFLIKLHRPEIAVNKHFLLILIIIITPLFFLQVVLQAAGISKLLFPAAMASMLITIFYGYRVGFWFIFALALLAGAMQGSDYQLTMMTLLIGSVGIVSVKQIRNRTQLLSASFHLGAASVIFLCAFNFLQYSISHALLQQISLAILNAVMTPIFVLGLAIILGNIFDITTDLTLIELSDLNRPLLKQLAAAAPGTYHHSLMVGTLSEAAAESVGANPLLARTASYYHDIGKIEKRDYFVENQFVFNPHDTIPPEESAQILRSHVLEGMELAEKHRLPQVIKDVIVQHHGTTIMQYFYHKALKKGNEVKKSTYQYPGPIPISKEAGIIMLADSVEAAVRSMGQASTNEIKEKIKETIETKFKQGQLDQCELSLNDLQKVEYSFLATFKAQAHHRIIYPSREEIEHVESAANVENNNN